MLLSKGRRFLPTVIYSFLFLILVSFASSTNYYFAQNGSDAGAGTQASPYKTIAKLNTLNIAPGSVVLFERGGTWKQPLDAYININSSVTYMAYGTGYNPIFTGANESTLSSDWYQITGNIWRSNKSFSDDIGNICWSSCSQYGSRNWTYSDLDQNYYGSWYYDFPTNYLYIISPQNPNTYFGQIDLWYNRGIFYMPGVHDSNFYNLTLTEGAYHGMDISSSSNLRIMGLTVHNIGGGYYDGQVRWGNGIQFWKGSSNDTVQYNTIYDVYDSAITQQSVYTGDKLNFKAQYNTIYNSGYCWEMWDSDNTANVQHILFDSNVCDDIGKGWYSTQRQYNDAACAFYGQTSSTGVLDYNFTNNICSNVYKQGGTSYMNKVMNTAQTSGWTNDYNIYWQYQTKFGLFGPSNWITLYNFNDWKTVSGKDSHSNYTDPLYINRSNRDYRLFSNSPYYGLSNNSVGGNAPVAQISQAFLINFTNTTTRAYWDFDNRNNCIQNRIQNSTNNIRDYAIIPSGAAIFNDIPVKYIYPYFNGSYTGNFDCGNLSGIFNPSLHTAEPYPTYCSNSNCNATLLYLSWNNPMTTTSGSKTVIMDIVLNSTWTFAVNSQIVFFFPGMIWQLGTNGPFDIIFYNGNNIVLYSDSRNYGGDHSNSIISIPFSSSTTFNRIQINAVRYYNAFALQSIWSNGTTPTYTNAYNGNTTTYNPGADLMPVGNFTVDNQTICSDSPSFTIPVHVNFTDPENDIIYYSFSNNAANFSIFNDFTGWKTLGICPLCSAFPYPDTTEVATASMTCNVSTDLIANPNLNGILPHKDLTNYDEYGLYMNNNCMRPNQILFPATRTLNRINFQSDIAGLQSGSQVDFLFMKSDLSIYLNISVVHNSTGLCIINSSLTIGCYPGTFTDFRFYYQNFAGITAQTLSIQPSNLGCLACNDILLFNTSLLPGTDVFDYYGFSQKSGSFYVMNYLLTGLTYVKNFNLTQPNNMTVSQGFNQLNLFVTDSYHLNESYEQYIIPVFVNSLAECTVSQGGSSSGGGTNGGTSTWPIIGPFASLFGSLFQREPALQQIFFNISWIAWLCIIVLLFMNGLGFHSSFLIANTVMLFFGLIGMTSVPFMAAMVLLLALGLVPYFIQIFVPFSGGGRE